MPKSNSSPTSLYESLVAEACCSNDANQFGASDLLGLPGVGPKTLERFQAAGVDSVADLVRILPRRYEDRRHVTPLTEVELGARVVTAGTVASVRLFGPRWRKMLEVRIDDGEHSLYGMWFTNRRPKPERFTKGERVAFSGLVSETKSGRLRIAHPTVIDLSDESQNGLSIVPIYPRLPDIPSATLAKAIAHATGQLELHIDEYLPTSVIAQAGLLPLGDSLLQAHQPTADATEIELQQLINGESPAAGRLLFDDLFFLQLGLALQRESARSHQAPIITQTAALLGESAHLSGIEPTAAQTRVAQEILKDISGPRPMRRLLQGDVGSGKTWVALTALLATAQSGHQGAMMVPTTVLAAQQYDALQPLFDHVGVTAAMLTANDSTAERRQLLTALGRGEVQVVIGTHALLQDDVRFKNLGLVIVDEQHRFGVGQRTALADTSIGAIAPHYLVMTATPIPRSLALTVYGDLDLSLLDELPPGRLSVQTQLSSNGIKKADTAIAAAIARGEQCYYICPVIDESDALNSTGIEKTAKRLEKKFNGSGVLTLHGRMSSDEKESSLRRFAAGEAAILVATTVVEVGVDVPNATVIVIDGAERFGLATLHQLRGRVGRGALPSSCHLIARSAGEHTLERLQAIVGTNDGFELAEIDLSLRGPGDLLGAAQSGLLALGRARLPRDLPILEHARLAAHNILKENPLLSGTTLAPLRKELARRLALLHIKER